MAQSYQLIGTVTVGSGGVANIEFTNISTAYTDLCVVLSLRSEEATLVNDVRMTVNNNTSSIYRYRQLYQSGGTPGSTNSNGLQAFTKIALLPGTTTTSNTFCSTVVYIPNYTSSNYKSVSVDTVWEINSASNYQLDLFTNLIETTSAISSINLYTPSYDIAQHSTAYLYGIGGSRASGGTITADANYTYHTFTSTGTFTALERIRGAEALVIAGGGGGGRNYGGGGGAGGFRVVPGLLLPAGNTYTVTVGAGGNGGSVSVNNGTIGSDSVFSTITSTGGGGGIGGDGVYSGVEDGGSGGGTSGFGTTSDIGLGNTPSTSPSQGNNGGYSGTNGASPNYGAGGGGGAGGVGGDGTSSRAGGAGGIGSSTASAWGYATVTGQNSGNTYFYAGGGGGGAGGAGGTGTGGAASTGGGGAGGAGNGTAGTAGTANLGGGGGGGGYGNGNGGAGGSGLVIIRYPNS